MDTNDFQTPFSKALLTGLFTGIIATLVCLVFDVSFRSATDFHLYLIINFPAMIFGCNLIMSVIGVIYSFYRQFLRSANAFFIATFAVLAALCLWKVQGVELTNTHSLNVQFREFLSGIIAILTVSALMIPMLYNNKKFIAAFI
ncbi:MAG: hypothetical protein JST47_02145 [Bacteroidetes bacterium]|nr:hypothetical protein [Bacteroidota bacterium]